MIFDLSKNNKYEVIIVKNKQKYSGGVLDFKRDEEWEKWMITFKVLDLFNLIKFDSQAFINKDSGFFYTPHFKENELQIEVYITNRIMEFFGIEVTPTFNLIQQ